MVRECIGLRGSKLVVVNDEAYHTHDEDNKWNKREPFPLDAALFLAFFFGVRRLDAAFMGRGLTRPCRRPGLQHRLLRIRESAHRTSLSCLP